MAVYTDAIIDFILHEARNDMGPEYALPDGSLYYPITPLLTREQSAPAMVWTETPVQTRYTMDTQGVYAICQLKPELVIESRRRLARTMADFSDALLGIPRMFERAGVPVVAHHNVAGFPVHVGNMSRLARDSGETLWNHYFGENVGRVEDRWPTRNDQFPDIDDDDGFRNFATSALGAWAALIASAAQADAVAELALPDGSMVPTYSSYLAASSATEDSSVRKNLFLAWLVTSPVHLIERVTIEGYNVTRDTSIRAWRGVFDLKVEISHVGQLWEVSSG